MRGVLPIAAAAAFAAGCGWQTDFSPNRARVHLDRLGGEIGSRPIGSPANAAAREYLAAELTTLGLQTRVQTAISHIAGGGVTGRVHNVIALLDGERPEAVALVAHYDSIALGSGAIDDALGAAAVMEAARVLATRGGRRWSLMIVLTDGEEDGLLGAEAAMTDAEVKRRVAVVLNLEAMGGSTPVMLFETGPGNGWLLDTWARAAPRPRGGSFVHEIYRRMPNDTDYSVFRRAGLPGLNFSAAGDAYTYHTPLERPGRVTDAALLHAGGTAVAVVDALEREDITRRDTIDARYVDVLGVVAFSWSSTADAALGTAALALGLLALVRVALALWRMAGAAGLVVTACWTACGVLAVIVAMVGSVALLRAVREVYHPWYSHPLRFVAALSLSGAAAGWLVARLAAHLPQRWRPPRAAVAVVLPTLVVWLGAAGATSMSVPRAAFLWTVPLLALALPIGVAGTGTATLVTAAAASAGVAAVLWIRDVLAFVEFLVPLLGGLPLVTPIWVLPALVAAAAVMVVPPAIALAVAAGARRPRFLTRILLVASGFAIAWAYHAPAYTPERPLRIATVSVSGESGSTVRLVSANEPLPPVGAGADALTPAPTPPDRFTRYVAGAPFVAIAPPQPARPPLPVRCEVAGDDVTIALDPHPEVLRARLELPAGMTPTVAEPPGSVLGDHWTAVLVGELATAATFRLTLPGAANGACAGRLYVQRRTTPAALLPAAGTLPAATWTARLVDVLPLR